MSESQAITPKKIKRLLAENELDQAMEQLLSCTEQQGLGDLHNQLIVQSGKLQQYKKERNLGSLDYASLTRTRVNLCLALLELADQLPIPNEQEKAKKLPGISERRFKRHILSLLLIGKVILFLYIFTIWQSGGLTFEGFLGTMGIVFPVFATYLSMVYQNVLSHRHQHQVADQLRINRAVQYSAYFFFLTYYVAIFVVLYLNTIGEIPDPGRDEDNAIPSYKNLFAMLALVESFIGVYIGKLIFSLFKKEA